ncbi:diguanylate cyclase [Acanthopleuribacter pedis]|uniref:diguanylate cyclase n=1 Tax=Acanthopleuribacter pedis TaxID=442870 RepID=A0A8J7QJZ1_9BACT|nr:diguanylate cyclase [Acanthopleuribacter pedis]MBO1319628.1 diguanylate cyclase [Acanthopleuribacter pedis]
MVQERVLIVEPSRTLATILERSIKNRLEMITETAFTYKEAENLLQQNPERFYVALVDVDLSDADQGDIVDLVTGFGVPCMVLTHEENKGLRRKLFSRNIIDYWIKEYSANYDYVVQAIEQLTRNREHKILIVDDSRGFRRLVSLLLTRKRYEVLEADHGGEALNLLAKHPDIRLVVTDYEMPEVNGFELTHRIRRLYDKSRVGVIGLSSSEEDGISARFLKIGANDFLKKPFEVEEFYCRINQNLEMLDLFHQIKQASNTDFLTKLFNRKYFFEVAPAMLKRAMFSGQKMAVAMIDIDHFKKINDRYGHDGGDVALVQTAQVIKAKFRPQDVVARFGGEEFCVFFGPIELESATRKLQSLCDEMRGLEIPFGNEIIRLTLSVGLRLAKGEHLDLEISLADKLLYEAKRGGRDQVMVQSE